MSSPWHVETFNDGVAIRADSTQPALMDYVKELAGPIPLIIADPPYGNVVKDKWDRVDDTADAFAGWMTSWTHAWKDACLAPGAAFYVWGGIGSPGFRPFFAYVMKAEVEGKFELANLITWKKRRAYGLKYNYLFTREECAYFVNGTSKAPRKFNIPLLDEKRGYSGYNKKYPAKSEFYRRSNVWTDINEIMHGKFHPTEKKQRLHEIMIEVHTDPGEWVVDPFAGSGVTAFAARKLGRKFVIIESDPAYFDSTVRRLRGHNAKEENTDERSTDEP